MKHTPQRMSHPPLRKLNKVNQRVGQCWNVGTRCELQANACRMPHFFFPLRWNDSLPMYRTGKRADNRANRVGVAAKVGGPEHPLPKVAGCEAKNGVGLWQRFGNRRMNRRPQFA